MTDPILNLIASCLGSLLGVTIGEFIFIPYLKKKINK